MLLRNSSRCTSVYEMSSDVSDDATWLNRSEAIGALRPKCTMPVRDSLRDWRDAKVWWMEGGCQVRVEM
jgi:hypothetical protein